MLSPATSHADASRLATLFARHLRAAITPTQMATVIDANRVRPFAWVCHSHDVIDANEVMAAAFAEFAGRPVDGESDADTALWNMAWGLAVETEFAV